MADNCVPDYTARLAANGPNGFGTQQMRDTTESSNVHSNNIAVAQKARGRQQTLEDLSRASALSDEPIYTDPTNSEQVHARALARQVVNPRSEIARNIGMEGRSELGKRWQDAVTEVNGTSITNATWWTNMQNHVAGWFENDRHDLVHWLQHIANKAGRLAYQNPVVQSFLNLVPKTRGINAQFRARQQRILNDLQGIANRTGRRVEDLFEDAGHYLNYLHMPEGNRNLLDNWFVELDRLNGIRAELEAKGAKTAGTDKAIGKLQQKIKNLQDHINDPNPPADVISRGYTDGQAKILMAELERTSGMTREELTTFARRISNEFNHITTELARAGLIDPKQLARIPEFEWYAPIMNREANLSGAANDASYYIANSQHQMQGTSGRVDSAASSLSMFAQRAATEMGMQDFGAHMYGIYQKARAERRNIGLLMSPVREGADTSRGMVIQVPIRQKDGSVAWEKRHMRFREDYKIFYK